MLLGKRFNLYKETRVRMNVEMEKRLKKTISARVDEKVLETFSKQGLPLSQVVEAGIVHLSSDAVMAHRDALLKINNQVAK